MQTLILFTRDFLHSQFARRKVTTASLLRVAYETTIKNKLQQLKIFQLNYNNFYQNISICTYIFLIK